MQSHAARATFLLAIALFAVVRSGGIGAGARGDEGFRVESEVFLNGAEEPVARSLTLFRDGIAWDFLERPTVGGAARGGEVAAGEKIGRAHV